MLVFISHSRQNSGAAYRLCEALEHRRYNTWLDIRKLDSGSDWQQKVAEAVREADALLFLIGPSHSGDDGQKFEWQQVVDEEYFLDSSKPLIPILLGNPEVPGFLRARKAIQVGESSIDFGALADEVAAALDKPEETVDQEKLELGRAARVRALEGLEQYSRSLAEQDAKRAGLRALE